MSNGAVLGRVGLCLSHRQGHVGVGIGGEGLMLELVQELHHAEHATGQRRGEEARRAEERNELIQGHLAVARRR